MDALPNTSEIVESIDDSETETIRGRQARMHFIAKSGNKCSIEEDINRLFEGINIRSSSRGVSLSQDVGKDALRKSAMKRPIKVGSSQASGIGISEPASLKQALRGLCISQASEMAAMKKRLSNPGGSSRPSEAGNIKRMYRAVVVEASGSELPINDGTGNVLEISLVPEKCAPTSIDQRSDAVHNPVKELCFGLHSNVPNSLDGAVAKKELILNKLPSVDKIVPLSEDSGNEVSQAEFQELKFAEASVKAPTLSTKGGAETPVVDKEHEGKLHVRTPLSISRVGGRIKPVSESRHLVKQVFRNKSFIRRKAKEEPSSSLDSSVASNGTVGDDLVHTTSCSGSPAQNCILKDAGASPASNGSNYSFEVNSSTTYSSRIPVLRSKCSSKTKQVVTTADDGSRSRGKGEFSQSSKSSIGDYSSSTSTSEESCLSKSARIVSRPHMSKDLRWNAIHSSQKKYGGLSLKHFKFIRKLGCGDIGIIYLAELIGTNCLFALKVMDNEFLGSRKKLVRAQTEKEIMQMLDHPFLPTLYAHFLTEKYSCLVMEYCPGGDLHILRQKQPGRNFSEEASRFYVAEVLLALEYLHMLGIVYRDLKPENILVREDGHIMLSDFDLSLRSVVNPVLVKSSPPESTEKMSSPCSDSSCIEPFCLNPSFQVPCFTPRLLSIASKSRKMKCDLAAQVNPMPQLVMEPTSARSNSFVGTHEYLAPEIIKGKGHGNAVDWWTYGIFLFELLYGMTPFKGSGNDETLNNVVSNSLRFPSSPMVSFHAKDLIRGLLVKDPENRLGSVKGAAEIKQHPFFDGINWALIRCATPPEMPKSYNRGISQPSFSLQKNDSAKCEELENTREQMDFDMF